MAQPSRLLSYSRQGLPVLRRPLTCFALLTFFAVVLVHLASRGLPVVRHNLSTYFAQRACLTYVPPPNHLLYDNSPEAYASLPRQPGYRLCHFAGDTVGPYALNPTLMSYLGHRTSDRPFRPALAAAFPFLHACTAAGRPPRLVTINFHEDTHDRRTYTLSATAEPTFSPLSVPPTWDLTCYDSAGPPFVFRLRRTDRLRLYAGSADPNDPAHFTIPLTINDTPYTLDGYLTATDTITLAPRVGPTAQTRTGPVWTPTNAPEFEPGPYLHHREDLY